MLVSASVLLSRVNACASEMDGWAKLTKLMPTYLIVGNPDGFPVAHITYFFQCSQFSDPTASFMQNPDTFNLGTKAPRVFFGSTN